MSDDQITIKIKDRTKKGLDNIKHSPSESYSDVIDSLIEKSLRDISIRVKNPDADWKPIKMQVERFKCPKCGTLQMSLVGSRLLDVIETYLNYNEPWELSRIKSALINSNLPEFKTEKDVMNFIQRLEEKNPTFIQRLKGKTPTGSVSFRNRKDIDYLGLKDTVISKCYKCNETFPEGKWENGTKKVNVLTCPRCDMHVEDDAENRTMESDILMCPKCTYYFDRTWEIFNHISQDFPTVDHLKYDRKNGIIKLHPYSCQPDYLVKLLLIARELNYDVRILGISEYHPDSLTIMLSRSVKPK